MDLQDFGGRHDFLLAHGGDSLPGHSVNLVEGVRTKVSVIRSADEQQQADRLLVVSVQLQERKNRT